MSRRATRATADTLSSTSTQLPLASHIAPSTAMYINSQYNHPAFNKLYLGPNLSQNGKSLGAVSAVPKPPKPPEKPLMPYMRYSRKVWDDVKASQPDLKLWEVGRIIGKKWRDLPSTDRQLYIDEYDSEKAEYQDLLKSYYNSPAYQGYLQAKGRADAIDAENRASERDDSIMSIEPADDGSGDTDEGFSVKHVSAARFQRNHRLMQNILLDSTVVPSSRGIVTNQRLEVLRKQVHSLQSHQKKLENELLEIERNHIETKKKWKESTSKFIKEMKNLCNVSPHEYYINYKKTQAALKLKAAEKQPKHIPSAKTNIQNQSVDGLNSKTNPSVIQSTCSNEESTPDKHSNHDAKSTEHTNEKSGEKSQVAKSQTSNEKEIPEETSISDSVETNSALPETVTSC